MSTRNKELSKLASKINNLFVVLGKHLHGYNYAGLIMAVIFFCLSFLPSLMPRPWPLQALLTGISVAIGYGLGVFLSYLIRWMLEKDAPKTAKPIAWRAAAIIAPIAMITFVWLGTIWQTEVRQLVGLDDGNQILYPIRTLIFSLAIGFSLIWLARKISRLYDYTLAKLKIRLPARISIGLSFIITIALIFWISSGVFFNFFVTQSNRIFSYRNEETPEGVIRPVSPNRSGSPASIVSWESLGRQGRVFISGGGSQEDIAEFNNDQAQDPIRIYIGVDAAPTPEERAQLALEELKRTNGLDRKILVLATPTGTGWLQSTSIYPVEYIHNGDTTIIAQQYSYLPSWISFLVDQQFAKQAGQELFEAVYSEWIKLPESERPMLVSYGLSLGSFGGQSAFSGVNDMLRSIDGAMYQGTPNNTEIWRDITNSRDSNSPEWQPIYRSGRNIRFASSNSDIATDDEEWQAPRVLYNQHASDPIVWWSWDLIFKHPDWLKEQRGPDVSGNVRWYPFVTFFGLAIDQMIGNAPEPGHGHLYQPTATKSWVAVTQADNWDAEKIAEFNKTVLKIPEHLTE
jgi:uncharacterized membrane protein